MIFYSIRRLLHVHNDEHKYLENYKEMKNHTGNPSESWNS